MKEQLLSLFSQDFLLRHLLPAAATLVREGREEEGKGQGRLSSR